MWKNRLVDFTETWTIHEEIQTEERNHARFSLWYGTCMHVARLSYFLTANANCEVVWVCVGCMEMNSGCKADIQCVQKKATKRFFCNIFYKTQAILTKFGTGFGNKFAEKYVNIFHLTWTNFCTTLWKLKCSLRRCYRCIVRQRNSGLWPPNSPDLNPVDYSMLGILQKKVYKTCITDLDELKQRLRMVWTKLNHVIVAAICQWRRW